MPVAIRQVESRKDFRRFVKYPYRLHRDEPRWIPPLIGQQYRVLNPRTELYFQHAEPAAFLAERDGQLVGRVLAHIDHELTAKLIEAGFPPYRAGVSSMDLLDPGRATYWEVVSTLKEALDPRGIIAPGRYDPRRARELRGAE